MSYNYNVDISFNHLLNFQTLTNKLFIFWTDPTNEELGNNQILWYDIEINNSIYSKKTTEHVILNVKPKVYNVRARANFPCGRTNWSPLKSYNFFYPAPVLDLSENLLGTAPDQYLKQSHITYNWTDPTDISYNQYILYINNEPRAIKADIDTITIHHLTDGTYNAQIRGINTLFQPPLVSRKSNNIRTVIDFRPSSIISIDLSFSEFNVNQFVVTIEDIHIDANDFFEVEMDPFQIIYEGVTRQQGRTTKYIFDVNHIGFNYRFKVRVNYGGYLSAWSEYFFKDIQYSAPRITRELRLEASEKEGLVNTNFKDNGHPGGLKIKWEINNVDKNITTDISFTEVRYELFRSLFDRDYEKVAEITFNQPGETYDNTTIGLENNELSIKDQTIKLEQFYYYKIRAVYVFFYKNIKYTKESEFSPFLNIFTCFAEAKHFPYGRFNHSITNEKLFPIISKCIDPDTGSLVIKRSGNIFKQTAYQLTASEIYSLFARTNGTRMR